MIDFLSEQNSFVKFLFFLFSSFLENLFPPWPGDLITIFAGFLVSQGESLFLIILSTFCGSLSGGIFMYKIGDKLMKICRQKHWFANFTEERKLNQIALNFQKYSYLLLLFSKFMAGYRFFICPISGLLKIRFTFFCISFSLSIILWNSILIFSGYLLGENWKFFFEILKTYSVFIFFIILFGIFFYILKFFKTRKSFF